MNNPLLYIETVSSDNLETCQKVFDSRKYKNTINLDLSGYQNKLCNIVFNQRLVTGKVISVEENYLLLEIKPGSNLTIYYKEIDRIKVATL